MLIHASSVALAGQAALIRGASGTGKSGLALQLMALGAALVADDRTRITLRDGQPVASCPDTIRGRIEARGLGVLAADPAPPAIVRLVVDLDRTETDRLPPERHTDLLGCPIPLFHKVESLHFAPAILQYLRAGPAMM